MRILNGQRSLTYATHALHRHATDRRPRHGSGPLPHQNGVEPVEFVYAACEAGDARRHANERSWRRLQRLRTSFRSGKDTVPALIRVADADKVLIDVWGEQPEQRGILATQDDHATLFRALGGIRLEARELHSSVRRLLVVAREQHNEVSRVLNGLMHLLDEIRSNRNVVVLDEDLVALLGEDVGDLLRNGGHRAPTAQEEVVSLTGTAWHRSDLVPCNGHAQTVGRQECGSFQPHAPDRRAGLSAWRSWRDVLSSVGRPLTSIQNNSGLPEDRSVARGACGKLTTTERTCHGYSDADEPSEDGVRCNNCRRPEPSYSCYWNNSRRTKHN